MLFCHFELLMLVMDGFVNMLSVCCEDVTRCSAEKDFEDASLKNSRYVSYKCRNLGPLFATL